MAKSGVVAQPIKKNGVAQRGDCLLSKEVALSLVEIVKQGGKLFTTEQWNTNSPIVIVVGETKTEVKPKTYDNWIQRDNVVPELNRTLRSLMAEARERRDQLRHEQQRKELIRKAQEGLKALQALPIGTKTSITKKKYRVVKDGEKYQTGEETEVHERDVDPQLVSIKHRGNEFVLERLDPAYSAKSESKNLTVTLSLSELRKAKEQRDSKKVDHEVRE